MITFIIFNTYFVLSCLLTLALGYILLYMPIERVLKVSAKINSHKINESEITSKVQDLRDFVDLDPAVYTSLVFIILLLFSPLLVIFAKLLKV